MRLKMRILAVLILASMLLAPFRALAIEGTLGYEGGISAQNPVEKDEYQYSEICFITGKPILLTGTLTIKKTDKNDVVNSTYTYRLSNTEHNATMSRVVLYTTTRETKITGQVIESTKLSRTPTETIIINNTTYRLTDASFSRSMITDPRAAINYHTGEFSETKVYAIGPAGLNNDTVTVTTSGRVYAYDQHWSSTQTQKLRIMVEADIKNSDSPVQWGGMADVIVSSVTQRQIQYSENEPTQITFEGGYVQNTWTESTLDYQARFPEFDKNGMPTYVLKTYSNTERLATPPEHMRLMVPDIKHLNGFWAEEQIRILYGLEVIPGTGENYKVGKYVTRREFVAMLVRALKDIPEDPNVRKPTISARKSTRNQAPEISPFKDVDPSDLYYDELKKAYQKGIVRGDGKANFNPDSYITKADAIKMIVSALGLENLAPYPYTSTPFTDNDAIPDYARNAVTVANFLGLAQPDERGRFNPYERLTNENTSDMLYNLISYMGDELVRDYRDRIMEF